MKALLRSVTLAASLFAAGALVAGPATARDDHRRHGWHHGYKHHHGFHRHGFHRHRANRTVIVVRPARRFIHTRRVVVVPAAPAQVIYRPVPVTVPVQSAAYCREYIQTVVIGGVQHAAYGTACLQPDGSWQKVN